MQRALHELVTGYADATGCSCKIEQGSCHAVLRVEDADIQIGLVEASGMMVFQTAVGILPKEDAGREEFCISLLGANSLFNETMGLTLGLDTEQELVTLQLAWDIYHLNAEGFACILNNLLSVTANWMIRLNERRPSLSNHMGDTSSADEALIMNSLKV